MLFQRLANHKTLLALLLAAIVVITIGAIAVVAYGIGASQQQQATNSTTSSSSTGVTSSSTSSTSSSSVSSTQSSSSQAAVPEDTFVLVGPDATDPKQYIKRFTSYKLGITFTLLFSDPNKAEVTVTRENNKVWVTPSGMATHDGQNVEVFSKETNQTLSQAVTAKFLAGYDPAQCYYKQSSISGNIEKGIIGFPHTQSSDAPWWDGGQDCPNGYTETNGVRFFYYDKTHSDKYAFFDIGQYAILGNGNSQDWATTFAYL